MSYHYSINNDSDTSDARREILEAYAKGSDNFSNETKDRNRAEADRYGFICKTTPTPMTKEDIEKERSLEIKWVSILSTWDKVFPSSKIRKLIFKGLANSVRGEIWKRILETPKLIKSNENKYEMLRYRGLKTSHDIKQIDLDINRTYRNHVMFSQRYGLKQKSLFNVLTAYTIHNNEVGYCQGMSSVAALILMYMDEEDAFWALSTLLTGQKHTMHGFFINGFPKLMRFQEHHAKILKKMLPSLAQHLEQQGIFSSLYTLKWYMQCFLDRLPPYLILRLWDVFVLEGDKILHPIGYTLLKKHKKKLMKMQMDELAQFLSSGMENEYYNADDFMDSLLENIEELKKHNLYPAPSVVKGELPTESGNSVKTIEENMSTCLRHSAMNISTQVDEENQSHASIKENELLDDLTGNNATIFNSNVRYRGLPPGIPLPPSYTAPTPTTLLFVKNNGRISLISENLSFEKRGSTFSTFDSYGSSRTGSYSVQKFTDDLDNSTSTEMATERLKNVDVAHNVKISYDSETSETQ